MVVGTENSSEYCCFYARCVRYDQCNRIFSKTQLRLLHFQA